MPSSFHYRFETFNRSKDDDNWLPENNHVYFIELNRKQNNILWFFLKRPYRQYFFPKNDKFQVARSTQIGIIKLSNMKKFVIFILGIGILIFMSIGCHSVVHVNSSGHIPPGQMKKMTGNQSAKPYAPGQQKEKNNHKSQ